jgi:hypothetical protein
MTAEHVQGDEPLMPMPALTLDAADLVIDTCWLMTASKACRNRVVPVPGRRP